jgi:hypothetical protein
MSDHVWVQENIATYVADGLTAAEQERVELHAASCKACAQALAESRSLEQMMKNVFASARPNAGLEDRAIKTLRRAPLPLSSRRSTMIRALIGAAAGILLTVLGGSVYAITEGKFAGFGPTKIREASVRKPANAAMDSVPVGIHLLERDRKEVEGLLGEVDGKRFERIPEDQIFERNVDTSIRELAKQQQQVEIQGKKPGDVGRMDPAIGAGRIQFAPVFELPQLKWAESSRLATTYYDRGEKADSNKDGKAGGESGGGGAITRGKAEVTKEKLSEVEGRKPSDSTRLSQTPRYSIPTELAKQDPGSGTPLYRTHLPSGTPPVDPPKKTPPPGQDSAPDGNPAAERIALLQPVPVEKPAPESENITRKIIRTGELEFEIESFNGAVESVTKLTESVKGGFRATVNSDKLANGKMRGSVVVRMPPQYVDKFLDDLRRELSKTGELKSQKIGSLDITKQYVDIESRLRGARAMEERFLNIIKTGAKGEIKDLIAAERELGIWRTKIEEMEGEIRYYAGQVALSTLTITLTEKEILAPSALVVKEHVGMRIEVEDVEKANLAALKAVADAKGRVTKSEFKQQAVGQFEAILHADIKPDAAPAFSAALAKLGVVRHQDAARTQVAEGGSGPPQELKPRYKDVHFEVVMHNTTNIQPRETFTLQLATLDVPESFRKLREAVVKGQGQVHVGKLNEQDKFNTTAQLDFDVPAQDKPALDMLIAASGQVLSRSNNQVAMNEVATDRRVGYRMTLLNVAGIAPREILTLSLEVADVEKVNKKAELLASLVRAGKGMVAGSKSTFDKEKNVAKTILVFDVPLASYETLVQQFVGSDNVLQKQETRNPQVPDNELATAKIYVTITNAPSTQILPEGEGLMPALRSFVSWCFKAIIFCIVALIAGTCFVLTAVVIVSVGIKAALRIWKPAPKAA